MSLFERLNKKRHSLYEAVDKDGNIVPKPGEVATQKSIIRNYNKKQKNLIAKNKAEGDKVLQNIKREVGQRVSKQNQESDRIARDLKTPTSDSFGPPEGKSSFPETKASREAKNRFNNKQTNITPKSIVRSDVPSSPSTSNVSTPKITGDFSTSKAQDYTKKINQKNPNRKEFKKFFDPEKAKVKRDELIAGRKAYIDPKTNKASKKGIERYIAKARDMKSGGNLNTKANQKAAKVIAKSFSKTYEKRINDKYGGKLARKRPSNAPSLATVKARIDAKNPTYKSPVTGGQLPILTRKKSTPKVDSSVINKGKIGQMNLDGTIDEPKTKRSYNKSGKYKKTQKVDPNQMVLQNVPGKGLEPIPKETRAGREILKKQVKPEDLVNPKPKFERLPEKPKKAGLFGRVRNFLARTKTRIKNYLKDPAPGFNATGSVERGTFKATRNPYSKNFIKRTFQKIPKKGKIGAVLATGLLGVSAYNALRPKGKDKGKSSGVVIPPFKAADYKPSRTTLSLTSNPNPQKDKKSPELPVNNNPNVRNLVNRVANYKRSTST